MAAAEIGSFPPGSETLFSFMGANYCPYYLLDTSEHLYGYP